MSGALASSPGSGGKKGEQRRGACFCSSPPSERTRPVRLPLRLHHLTAFLHPHCHILCALPLPGDGPGDEQWEELVSQPLSSCMIDEVQSPEKNHSHIKKKVCDMAAPCFTYPHPCQLEMHPLLSGELCLSGSRL